MPATPQKFIHDVLHNPANCAILERLPALNLPDAWLVAGCLFQTVWNLQSGLAPDAAIKDYDLFYFDASDLSAAAEAAVQAKTALHFADVAVAIEAKNQARVHTWYPDYFGRPYAPLRSSQEGIDRFLVPCTCVGLSNATRRAGPVSADHLTLYAPYGLDELYKGILRPNPLCDHPALFADKVRSYQARWPGLHMRKSCTSVTATNEQVHVEADPDWSTRTERRSV